MKVLIADDSTTMRRILITVLAKAGLTDITEACDGQQAVSAVETDDFGLILMDWNMPNLSGFDALKAIRAAGKRIPIIMVTTEVEKNRVLDALRSGANNYIVKPFTPEMVLTKVADTLGLNVPHS